MAAHATTKADFVHEDDAASKPVISFRRPRAKTGLVSWLTTVDHKRIGILYGAFGFFFLLVGGLEALLIRIQLAFPNNTFISAQFYNELFTMHGTTMIFLAVMPMSAAFFNYMVPLQIGARDVAFPRLNAFSLWTFVAGAIILNFSWISGFLQIALLPDNPEFASGAPDIGWFGYANLTSSQYSPGLATDYWIFGLQILGVASVAASLNFIVTIINMRAPGMTMMRLPVFTWMTLVTAFLIVLSFPAITIALAELMFDRLVGTHFFEPTFGGQPILWQHLFWIFGHPEVYILILPAMGIISEILPTFSRKPLFGYPIVVFSGAVIGLLGFAVWAHHMFTTGLGTVAKVAFSLATMAIAVPTGVKIFNWIGTLWGGRISYRVPMVYACGFIWMFMMGGLTGVMHSAAPADAQQQDSYFVVAHFHYVLIGGSIFSLFAGIYYWFPKMFGKMMNERLGMIQFAIIFIGFNVAFFPMHFLGMDGMPRRQHSYDANLGWNEWNLVSTIGALILGAGVALFIVQMVWTLWKGKPAPADPWDARTLEWTVPSPPPEYNFARIPEVKARDHFFFAKHHPDKVAEGPVDPHEREHGIHMPDASWWPLVIALGMLVGAFGILYDGAFPKLVANDHLFFPFVDSHLWDGFIFMANWLLRLPLAHPVSFIGLCLIFGGIYLWALEGPAGYHVHPDKERR